MISLDAAKLAAPFSYIGGLIAELKLINQIDERLVPPFMPLEMRALFLFHVNSLSETAQRLKLTTFESVLKIEREGIEDLLAVSRPYTRSERSRLVTFGDKLLSVFISELRSRVVVSLALDHAKYFDALESNFGKEVSIAFPNSSFEICEAGRCRSVGLWNAMVMHLMRAIEEPLSKLAVRLEVDPEQNWNTVLNQIEKALQLRRKSVFGEDEEQWASEAAAHVRAIKNAWRNHAQHGRAVYEELEAISIWHNVKSLLQSLARRL